MPRKGYGVETPAGSGFCVSRRTQQSKTYQGYKMQQRLRAAVWAVFIFAKNPLKGYAHGNC